MKKHITATMLTVVLLMSFACTKGELLQNAEDVLSSLHSAQPLLAQFLPSAAPKIEQAVTIAGKLKDAISASQSAQAIGLLSDLIPVFQSIVENDISQIKSAALRTQLMAALALADISLHFLVSRLQSNAPAAMTGPHGSVLADFAKQEVWGNRYKRK